MCQALAGTKIQVIERLALPAAMLDRFGYMVHRTRENRVWHPHDHFVEVCLSVPAIARKLISSACTAAVAEVIDWKTLRLEPTVFKSVSTTESGESRSDLVCSANWRESEDKVYFQIEHFSVGRMPSALRLQAYREGLRRHLLLKGESDGYVPFIFQILLIQGRSPVKLARYRLNTAARTALGALATGPTSEPLVLVMDVAAIHDAALYADTADACFLLILKAVRQATVMEHLSVILKHIQTLDPFTCSGELPKAVLDYLPVGVPDIDKERYSQIIEATFPPTDTPVMRTLAQSWIEEGYAEGRQEGLREGEARGEARGMRETLLVIMEDRQLGQLSPSHYQKLVDADEAALKNYIRRALRAASVDAVFTDQ